MSYKFYYKPGACSMAVHVILNELNVPFEAIRQDDLKAPDFLKMNPRGQVPLLLVGDEPVKEGAALIAWLLDTHDNNLMPKSGLARAKALEWLMWCNASLHPACGRIFGLAKMPLDDATKAQLSPLLMNAVQALWDEADARLAKTAYLAGDQLTAADILLAVIANWGVGQPGAHVKRVLKDVVARPAYQKTLAAEQIAYKAVA